MPEHERWETRFGAPGYLFGKEPNAFLKSQAHRLRKGATALSVADGEGRNGVFLAEQGLDVLSVDFSPAAQEKARKLAAERGVPLRTELSDLSRRTFERDAYDVVAAIMIQFAPSPVRERVFAGAKEALRRGGIIIVQGYRPEQLQYKTGGPPDAENMYTEPMLREIFSDMRILHLRAHDDVIAEGAGHSGMSALIDLVAEKP